MGLSVGSIVELIGLAIVLAGGCSLIVQSFRMKRDKKIRGVAPAFVDKEKIENPDAYCLYLSFQFLSHGIITVLLSCVGIAFVFLSMEMLSNIMPLLIFANIIIYLVRIHGSAKKFYRA